MSRKKDKVEKSLLAKGFQLNQTHHHYFIYYTKESKKTTIKTKTSHTGKIKNIPDNLLAKMAKQCHLTKSDFLSLIDCPLSREEYENKLYEQEVLKSNGDQES